ncbi:hypothetical protein H6P81_013379 [Aristolochia fimbriata]|uniref:Cytochrome P450 n=1 Tax=Aristolochia fimbriata TaxID=158543 RepID=A0AAV7EHD8_ARIFI|nr:hypothetical protein H6P81_013379 [Aristolochia fimbriata]
MAFFLSTLFLFVSSFAFLLFVWNKQRRNNAPNKREEDGNKKQLPPGPRKVPIIGNLHQLGELPHRSLHLMSLRHGPLMFLKLGSVPLIVVSSADTARELIKNHDLAISNRPVTYAQRKLSYGCADMVFAPYGEYWRQVRKLCTLELLSLKRAQSFRAVREEEVALLLDSIAKYSTSSSSSTIINLSESVLALLNDIVCRTAFGNKYREAGEEYSCYGRSKSRFNSILSEFQELLATISIVDFFAHMEWIHKFTGWDSKLEKIFRELDAFYNEVIEAHQNPESKRSSCDGEDDLVGVLLKIYEDRSLGISLTMNNIKGVLMDIFVAGTDTSSALVIWAMAELMRNPSAMKKEQEELRKAIGKKDRVEESDLHGLDYLKAIIKETFRMHPPAPLLVPRETIEELTFDGYTIPAKAQIFVNARAIGLDPKCWECPEEFRPERFLNSPIDYKGQHFELIPFGAGRRGCPGINFATPTVELTLANLLHRFDWEFPPGMGIADLDMKEAIGMTTQKRIPLQLVAIPKA